MLTPLLPMLLLLLLPSAAFATIDMPLGVDGVNFNTKVGNLARQDPSLPSPESESGQFQDVRMTPLNDELDGYFAMDRQTTVSAIRDIDRDELCPVAGCCESIECRLDYTVSITVRSGFVVTRSLRLILRDENDQKPSFPSLEPIDIAEDAPVGFTGIRLATASDKDSPPYRVKNYSMTDPSRTFDVYIRDGVVPYLKLLVPLDREQVPQYQVTLRATDGLHESTVVVTIRVTDVNDNSPIFNRAQVEHSFPENLAEGSKISTLAATDSDSGPNANLTFTIASVTPAALTSHFSVNIKAGHWGLFLASSLDYEKPDQRSADILVVVRDQGSPPRSSTGTVQIRVTDYNDNDPVIKELSSHVLEEHMPAGQLVKTLLVTDADRMSIGLVTCEIDSANPRFRLQRGSGSGAVDTMERLTYNMTTTSSFDYEVSQLETVKITCLDSASPERFASRTYEIPINETNDFAPAFDTRNYHAAVYENRAEGLSVLPVPVKAFDKDKGTYGVVLYELDSEGQKNFSIHQSSGIVEVRGTLDRETAKYLSFKVIAKNYPSPRGILNDTAKVVIELLDVNDNKPQYLGPPGFSVVENSPPGTLVGRVEFQDDDAGENGTVRFRISGSGTDNIANEYLRLSDNGSITVEKRIDREMHSKFFLVIEAWDLGRQLRQSSTVKLDIEVQDVNDSPPVIREPRHSALVGINPVVYTDLPRKSMLVLVLAEDKDRGENGTLTYRLGPGNATELLGIDADKGELHSLWDPQLEPPMPGIYSVTVIVSDRGTPKPLEDRVAFYLKLTAPRGQMYRFGSAGLSGLIILVVIIAGTVIIAVGLIAAICYVRGRSGLSAFGADPADSEARVKMTDEDAGCPGYRDSPRIYGTLQQQQLLLQQQHQQQQMQQQQQHQQQFYTWQRSGSPMGSLMKEDCSQVYRPLYMMDCPGGGGGVDQDCLPLQQHIPVTRSNHTFGRGVTMSPRPPPPMLSCAGGGLGAQNSGLGSHHLPPPPPPHHHHQHQQHQQQQQHERRHSEDASVDDSGRGGSVEDMKGGAGILGSFVSPPSGSSGASSSLSATIKRGHQHASTLLVLPDPTAAGTMI